MELKQKRFEQRQMEQYMNKIQGLYLELKGFRHDFGNIITSLNLAIEEENIDDIKRIQRDVLEECYGQLQKEEYTGFDLGNIRDSALRSILSRGWIYAEEMGVKLTFETEDIIEKVPMRLLDLVRTVGILVNNAIEAAKMSQEKEVQIAVFNMPNGVHLIIKNSISDEPINWNRLYEKGFSTKGDRRGMGLAIVKDLIGEYAAIFLETELINGRFTQSLVIGEKGRQMNIVLLEDEISQQVRVEKHVKAIAEEEGLRLNIVSTSKITELKEYLTNGDFHQLFFLDIDIKGDEKAGIKAAQMIREVNPFAIIAFITTKSEFATITYRYKVSALEFIEKTLNENLFKEKIRECILYLKKNVIENKNIVDFFEYSFKNMEIRVPYRDILYIETTGVSHKLRLVGKNFQKEFLGTIKDILEKDVDNHFFSPNQSYLVNQRMIVNFDRRKRLLMLEEETTCPVSRTQVKKVEELLNKIQKKA